MLWKCGVYMDGVLLRKYNGGLTMGGNKATVIYKNPKWYTPVELEDKVERESNQAWGLTQDVIENEIWIKQHQLTMEGLWKKDYRERKMFSLEIERKVSALLIWLRQCFGSKRK